MMLVMPPVMAVPAYGWAVPMVPMVPMLPAQMVMPVAMPQPQLQPQPQLHLSTAPNMSSMPVQFNAGQPLPSNLRILCIGDSLTAGFYAGGQAFAPYGRSMGEALASVGLSCEVSVCGYSGRTTQHMVEAMHDRLVDIVGNTGLGLARILQANTYDLVLIMSGTNDMAHNHDQERIMANLGCLHALCHERGIPTVALMPPPAPIRTPQHEAVRQNLIRRIQGMTNATPGIRACVDPAEFVPAAHAPFWENDGLHFSPAGSHFLGTCLATMIAETLTGIPASPDPEMDSFESDGDSVIV
eukprot:gb/GFBE01013775.1/.p1 GENE.gb/GFBE01013775.1/~~gb/GFBE01013775.1/.p1  ORF type:complete len:298 (+),score=45.28 gb/GFBE01013775.1/:1-894(+)